MGGQPALGVGLDEAWDRATPDQIKAYGASFVCRYLGEDRSGKNLSRAEAEQLSAAGLWIVSNYEYSPGGALKGYWEGRRVARLADQQHRACGGPAGRPIYFSVDIDITNAAQMAAVLDWARGINDEIGVSRTGVYGEYDVIRTLFDAGRIWWGWQTYAWSPRGVWDGRAQIRQVANGISVSGHDVDRDENYAADYGQWMIGDNTMAIANEVVFPGTGQTLPEYLTTMETQVWAPAREAAKAAVTAATAARAAAEAANAKLATIQTGGQPTQAQVDSAVLAAMLDPRVQKGIGDAVASHLKVT